MTPLDCIRVLLLFKLMVKGVVHQKARAVPFLNQCHEKSSLLLVLSRFCKRSAALDF